MVDRRTLLAAGAGAAVVAGCGSGGGEEQRDQVSERLVTSVQGDIEILETLIDHELAVAPKGRIGEQDREHAQRLQAEITRLGKRTGRPAVPGAGPGDLEAHKEQTIALYVDAIPKISDETARRLAAGILASHAAHLASLRSGDPAPEAFVYGKAPDA